MPERSRNASETNACGFNHQLLTLVYRSPSRYQTSTRKSPRHFECEETKDLKRSLLLCGHGQLLQRPIPQMCHHTCTFKQFMWIEKEFLMGTKIMLTYPQFDKPFIVYTVVSKKQIGGVITQENRPLGFFSKKLTDTQCCYPVTEQELLAIIETLKYFKRVAWHCSNRSQESHSP
jgi:hypothetical protein